MLTFEVIQTSECWLVMDTFLFPEFFYQKFYFEAKCCNIVRCSSPPVQDVLSISVRAVLIYANTYRTTREQKQFMKPFIKAQFIWETSTITVYKLV